MFEILNGRTQFYQWDQNQKLIVNDSTINEVHFCNRTDDCALICEVYEADGRRVVDVPNILLTSSWNIRVYAYCGDCYTKREEVFKVIERSKPSDYIYTETEVKNYEQFEERLKALEEKEVDVDLTDYVKRTDYATSNKAGVVKANASEGITIYNGTLSIDRANQGEIEAKTNGKKPIVPAMLDRAVKTGITTNTIGLTEEEQAAAHSWLGLTVIIERLAELEKQVAELIGGGGSSGEWYGGYDFSKPSEGLEIVVNPNGWDENQVSVISKGSCTDSVIVIPSTYDGKAVNYLEGICQNDSTIEAVYIPETITWMGMCAFAGCPNLKVIYMEGVTQISSFELYDMTSLEYVKFGKMSADSDISGGTFTGCTNTIFDFSDAEFIPSFGSYGEGSEFGTNPLILVPANLYEEWKNAEGWSNYNWCFAHKGGADNPNIIEFTVNGSICCAEDGMTWGAWCDSKYNTIGAYVNKEQGNLIYVDVSQVCKYGSTINDRCKMYQDDWYDIM